MPVQSRFKVSEADTDLIARLNQQDQDAMRMLTERYSRMIYAVALRILKSPAEAEDTVQDVLLQLWTHPPAISEKHHSLAPWIAISTRNRAIDLIRRRPAADSHDLSLLHSRSNIAKEVETQTDMRRIHQAIRALPLKQQFVLQLAFRQELSHPEIAKSLAFPWAQ